MTCTLTVEIQNIHAGLIYLHEDTTTPCNFYFSILPIKMNFCVYEYIRMLLSISTHPLIHSLLLYPMKNMVLYLTPRLHVDIHTYIPFSVNHGCAVKNI